ncbi:MAG: acetyl-CoA carboxylase, biotin carboxyl carrier protein [Candidatus Zixiibacteriota bacterium]|nr:MAG: acetyl-CoA carboxylase, biotin carboxyl carrier protein [candidate division Zixibacteria bacterium]
MNENYIKKLIKLVEESEIESLEISSWGRKVRITQRLNAGSNGHGDATVLAGPSSAPPVPIQPSPAAQSAPVTEPAVLTADSNMVEIKSPMVGTFYRSPSPDAGPYVSPNEKIASGQVVCIVEAMKLMNEIESEVSGRVIEILAENAKPVEFGQVLFLIDPNG